MKKILSVLIVALMLISMSITGAGAYTLPEGLWVSDNKGDLDDVLTNSDITGICYGYVGDANCDNAVNIKDTTAIQKHIAELELLTATGIIVGDVDFSGEVNIKDATTIQKWLAEIEVDSPIFHTLCMNASVDEAILGSWETVSDIADIINSTLVGETDDPLMAQYVNISEFYVKGVTTYYFDGTYTSVVDREYLENSVSALKAELEVDIYNYYEASIKSMGYDFTVEDMLKYMGYSSMKEYVNTIVTDETIEYMAKDTEGTYYAADGILYTDGIDNYEYYTIEGDTLTITGNFLGEYADYYPVIFTRVDE